MRIFVIGGTGFIGRRVTTRLARDGHDLWVLHRGKTRANLPDTVRRIRGTRDDLASSADRIARASPDVIVDMVPYTEAHVTSLLEVLDAVSHIPSRAVVISSSDVYRNYDGWRGVSDHEPDPVPLDSSSPLREAYYPYRGKDLDFAYTDAYDKILVERRYREGPIPAVILRLPAVYGPAVESDRFAPYLSMMLDGSPVIRLSESHARWTWTHGYVDNVAAAIALATTDGEGRNRVYNLGESSTPTVLERLEMLRDATGWSGSIDVVPATRLREDEIVPGNWRYHLEIDSSHFHARTGFVPPVSPGEALEQVVERH